jgi:hypothetical protein
MRKHPAVANRPALHVCLCVPSIDFVCQECQAGTVAAKAQSIEEADALGDECPWNPDDLPEHLRGFGHRGADQDGFDGSEWVTPEEDHEAQTFEAARVLLDAREIP